jgi:phage tail protein X
VRSALGENLDLRIPVTIGKGESIEPSCFTLSRDPGTAGPGLAAARVSLERSAQGTYLRIRSDSYVNEPALALTVVAACPGQFAEYRRDYSLLIDPRTPGQATAASSGALAPARAPSETAPIGIASLPAAVATLFARIGDTLESIADAIFPRNQAAQKSYIDALRESNPPLAALGDRDPIPVDTPIALPDLRSFARTRRPAETSVAEAPARAPVQAPEPATPPPPRERPARAARPAAEPRLESRLEPRAAPRATPREEPAIAKAPAPVRAQPTPGFVLKLSSAEVDLTRSRAIDDRMRAQLRDRLLVLDADDQVAAVLALRNSVRQLESRVAELQLKLAGMPSSFPPAKTAEAPKAVPAPAPVAKPQPVKPEPVLSKPEPVIAKPEPVIAKPEPVVAQPAPPPVVESAKPEPIVAAPAPAVTAKTESPSVATAPVPSAPPEPRTAPRPARPAPAAQIDWLYYGLWAVAFLLIAAAATLAWRLTRRRREETFYDDDTPTVSAEPEDDRIVVADEFREEPVFAPEPEPPVEAPRRELDSDVELSTRLPDTNTDDLRRRYIEERFPEIGKGAIVLDDAASVVKGARLFYEDGALARAVELLHYAIERKPGEVRTWLALFEIFRLERLTGEFAELARRFRENHGKGEYWRKVQYFGREIDPSNELYTQAPLNTFETIGPSQARRLAAEASFDPVAENWLGMPMDFQNEVLANELRKALMAEARINEQDLIPNPMPALRNIEMFSVA